MRQNAIWVVIFLVTGIGAMNAMGAEYDVGKFGAVGDGKALNTAAIQKALDACAQGGGGTVRFPAGVFKAGTLELRSNVTLQLDSGATLLQSHDLRDFVKAEKGSYVYSTASEYAFLHGKNVTNVSIVGAGTLDGNKGDMVIGRDRRGPLSVIFENSSNITVRDVTVVNSPGWSVTFYGCKGVRVLNVKCLKSFADGINPCCCQDVLYDGVLIDGSGDDAITIKNESAVYPPSCPYLTRDIVVRNSTVRNTGHPAVKLGTGTYGVFRNVTVSNCVFENVGIAFAIQLMRKNREKNEERAIENVTLSNIVVKKVRRVFDITSLDMRGPVIRGLSVENFRAEGVSEPSYIYGLPGAPIRDVSLSNVSIIAKVPMPFWLRVRHVDGLKMENVDLRLAGGTKSAILCENASGLVIVNVNIAGMTGEGPAIRLNEVKGAQIVNCGARGVETFLCAEGAQTERIALAGADTGSAKTPFDASPEVGRTAVSPAAQNVRYSDLRVSERVKPDEGFTVDVTLQNAGGAGAFKVEADVDGKAAGAKWVWLRTGETRKVTLTTRRYYKPESHTIKVGGLTASGTVEPTPARFQLGDMARIVSPAAAGETTTVSATLKNVGGREGTGKVELIADGKAVASKEITLGPGEEKEIALEHRFAEAGPHKLKLGDFPVWPFATFANTPASFWLARDGRIIIEAGGATSDIRSGGRLYAAVYLKGVQGDFLAAAKILRQQVTGMQSGGGLIVKNDMTKPKENGGVVVSWQSPKYNAAGVEGPMEFKIAKKGQTFSGAVAPVSPGDAAPSQDVGIFATACSERNETCRVEFERFSVNNRK